MADQRVALVTGGASGIGEATARKLAADGDRVVVSDANAEGAEAVAADINADGGSAVARPLDVTDDGAIDAVVSAIEADLGPIDVLVNSAGILENAVTTADIDLEHHDRLWAINYRGTFMCSRRIGNAMVARGTGSIVNIASITSYHPFPLPAYSPSKAAVKALTEHMAVEFGRAGVRVNAVAPTYTLTPAVKSRIQSGHRDPDMIRNAGALKMFVEAEHIADGIHFLCSPAAAAITGITLPIDAGFLAAVAFNHYVGGKPWEE